MLGKHSPAKPTLAIRQTCNRAAFWQPRRLASYAIALVLHMLALYYLAPTFSKTATQQPHRDKPVRFLTLKPLTQPATPPKSPQTAPKLPQTAEIPKTLTTPIKGQVVDMSPTQDTTVDPTTPYLAEQNSHVEQQTRSKRKSPSDVPAKSIPKTGKPPVAKQTNTASKSQKTAVKTPVLPPQQISPANPAPAQISGIGRAMGSLPAPRTAQPTPLPTPTSPPAAEAPNIPRKLTMIDLVPSMGFLAHLSEPDKDAGGANHDYLDNIKEGEGTFLNTREFKYAAFFNRLKHSVSQVWQPLPEYQRRDPTGQLYGYKSRTTALTVTLDAQGNLLNVTLRESSGLDFLDQTAINAFYKAQPFTHPPRDLVDSQGHIQFPFQFYISFDRTSFY